MKQIHIFFTNLAIGILIACTPVTNAKDNAVPTLMPVENSPNASPLPATPLFMDDFNDPAYAGKYNTNLWTCNICPAEPNLIIQNDNSLRFDGKNASNGNLTANDLVASQTFPSSQLGYAQWRMKLLPTDFGGMIQSFDTDIASGTWVTGCYFQRSPVTVVQAVFGCYVSVGINEQGAFISEYTTDAVPTTYDEWHTMKIELVPKTFELLYYLDGKLIGKYIPLDAVELKTKAFRFGFGLYSNINVTSYIDDVIIQPAK